MTSTKLQARCVLLDIEGTISDIRFVYDVMFPYAKSHLDRFLSENWSLPSVQDAVRALAADAGKTSAEEWLGAYWKSPMKSIPGGETNSGPGGNVIDLVCDHCKQLMATDSKTTGLKMLQGMIWQSGFENGELRAELFADVLPALTEWKANGLDLRIYSSGSVLAQKMFFKYTILGDLTDLFSAHYDTTVGSKKDAASYSRIAAESQYEPGEIVFVTDVLSELIAASHAGMQVVASVRPNNIPLSTEFTGLTITSFSQLEFSTPETLV